MFSSVKRLLQRYLLSSTFFKITFKRIFKKFRKEMVNNEGGNAAAVSCKTCCDFHSFYRNIARNYSLYSFKGFFHLLRNMSFIVELK